MSVEETQPAFDRIEDAAAFEAPRAGISSVRTSARFSHTRRLHSAIRGAEGVSRQHPHLRHPVAWPKLRLATLFLVLFAALAIRSTSISPAVAADGKQRPVRPTGLEVVTEAGSPDWDDVEGADDYRVRWRKAGPGYKLTDGVEIESSTATIILVSHGERVVRLEACNDIGFGGHLVHRFEVGTAPEPTQESTATLTREPTSVPAATPTSVPIPE